MNFAPSDSTCSLVSGRTSVASTTAPSRLAVAIACKPATPTPMTTTRAAFTVPAAVISIGMSRPYVFAAISTALYPPMFACEESTSMLCAREMRGSASMAKAVRPLAASAAIPSLS